MLIRPLSTKAWLMTASCLCLTTACGTGVAQTLAKTQATAKSQAASSPFPQWDKNQDGYLSQDEFPKRFPASLFKRIDADGDGRISRNEDDRFRAKRSPAGKGGGNRGDNTKDRSRLPADATLDQSLVYETINGRELPLDLYRPQAAMPTPLVIWIHGGGWKSGSKAGGGPAVVQLLQRGYAVASVEYRLSGEAIFPAAIADCKAAVSFLRLHAEKYNLDPKRFGVWGSSAGGHLVSLLGTTNDVDDFDIHPVTRKASSNVQAVCNWFGPSDFLRMNDFPGKIDHDRGDSPESLLIGVPIQKDPKKVQRANPATYASAGDPPFLHLHGDKDQLVPFNQSEILHEALKASGVETTLYKVVGGGHGFGGATDSRESLIEKSLKFFDSKLKSDSP
jgi:acetyl esterase/lipase